MDQFTRRIIQANLRVLEVVEIKTVPDVPRSHPFVERLIGNSKERVLESTLILDNRGPGGEAARVSRVF
jgi:hypothetical protein